MEIIAGVERRRRWSLEEKLRIVAETEQPGGGICRDRSEARDQPWSAVDWRSHVRRGVLRPEPPPVFLPVRTISEPTNGNGTKHVEASSGPDPVLSTARSKSRNRRGVLTPRRIA